MPTLPYYRRIFSAYLFGRNSHLTFWHETPAENLNASSTELGEYYMLFAEKADYKGAFDSNGIPQLDYHGHIGLQYNPVAIAQYGLANYNLWRRTGDPSRKDKFFRTADWLCNNLEQSLGGLAVWNHHFDWEYRDTLKAPWYSALAQGQGISVLVRAHKDSGSSKYLEAARQAFASFQTPIEDGGVAFTDKSGDLWFEEYLVSPPTHILNGFIWALWGVHDYALATGDGAAAQLFERGVRTLTHNLNRYDLGFWSLYEQSGTLLPMVASAFYHRLHIVQLRLMYRLTNQGVFSQYADRWDAYARSRINQTAAHWYKIAFKLAYY